MTHKIIKLIYSIKANIIIFCFITFINNSLFSQGYYKDIFMNGGIKLTSRTDLPAARRLNLSIEHFVSGKDTPQSPLTHQDTILQQQIFSGSETDLNGVLLYPDGAPRFRMIYVNGGKATPHGTSLSEKGRANIQTFVNNGGSYLGTCAGMFLAWAALTKKTSIPALSSKSYSGSHKIPVDSIATVVIEFSIK